MLKNKRILITGGAGFIGSTLAKKLIADNDLLLYDNLARDARDQSLKEKGAVEFVEGNILDYAKVLETVKRFNPTHIVHAAAIAGIDSVQARPADTIEIDTVGTFNILNAARELDGLERVVCFSTSEVFGSQTEPMSETSNAQVGPVGESRWVYAVAKLATEHAAYAYFKQHGVPTVSVRPFNVYGPGQVGEGALSKFTKLALNDKDITLNNGGEQVRAWCFVDDMVKAVMLCLEHENAVGKAFNVGNAASACKIKDLAEKVVKTANSKSRIIVQPKDGADIMERVLDIEYPKNEIGFIAGVTLDEGLKKTIDFYRANPDKINF
jgi:nucleoside-diphosphate-sugar epimerase